MTQHRNMSFLFLPLGILLLELAVCPGSGPPPFSSRAERRFPPLVVPPGFHATLFACDPLIEYPSAIARGPRPGTLFVAVDFMTGLGTRIERRDEVRLLEDSNGDGRADKSTVVASGFNSIQGLAYHEGTLYVMHAPYLSSVRLSKKGGTPARRRDLLTGLGLPPDKDPIRLHNANGVVVGHDGWLYLALGDHGCDVKRPEGDRLVLEGGGILRCRPDGSDLHVFATGLRNIYDIALDDELNVFVRDNENDGGDYKIRVCHSFFGADHGYPYLYQERADEALRPLADLGLGSSAGGLCYLERQFPDEYRGNLFFCEWGRAVVRYSLKRSGASFGTPKEIDFASGAATDPYGFKPTDLVVDHEGSLFIADWGDGQRPRRGRGRIYHIRHVGKDRGKHAYRSKVRAIPAQVDEIVAWLDSESYDERCRAQAALERRGKEGVSAVVSAMNKDRLTPRGRLHAVWILARVEGAASAERLFRIAKADPDARIRAQAVRALADLTDPVLTDHRLDAGPGPAAYAARLASLGLDEDARAQLEVVVALGRLRWPEAPGWLRKNLESSDPALAHAAVWTTRRANNWLAVLKSLDEPEPVPFRAIARRAVAGQYDTKLIDGLLDRLKKEKTQSRRLEYSDALSRVWRKPGSWTYWGFRPEPRPANTITWDRSAAIEDALNLVLATQEVSGRVVLLRRMLRENVPIRSAILVNWLAAERDAATVTTILNALRGRADGKVRLSLHSLVRDRKQTSGNRLLAVSLLLDGLDADDVTLVKTATTLEDGPVLTALLPAVAKRNARAAAKLVLDKCASSDAEVRATAVEVAGGFAIPEGDQRILERLRDPHPRVRSAAARTAGKRALRTSSSILLSLAQDPDAEVRRSSLEALRLLGERRALPIALSALEDNETVHVALECISDLGGPGHARTVAQLALRRPSAAILETTGKMLSRWAGRSDLTIAEKQEVTRALAMANGSGSPLAWHVLGSISEDSEIVARIRRGVSLPTSHLPAAGWRLVSSSGMDGRVRLVPQTGKQEVWLAYCELEVGDEAKVEFFTTRSAETIYWLNGKVVHKLERSGFPRPDPDRFEATLVKGTNRLLVRLGDVKEVGEFQLRFRRISGAAEQERLARAALSRPGDPQRGRKVFLDAEKSLCIKCHRIGDQGEQVGPDLSGLGNRFSRIYIIESILEPGRTVSPSFETTAVLLKKGTTVSGIKVAESTASITLVDSETKKHVIARSAIEEVKKQLGSSMPDGLEKRLTEEEFVDLIAFLMSRNETLRR